MYISEKWQVLASPSYPVNEWLDLGTFTAKFVQGEQTFDIPEPVFARYVYTCVYNAQRRRGFIL